MYVQVNLLGVPVHHLRVKIIPGVFHVHIAGNGATRYSPIQHDGGAMVALMCQCDSNSEHALVQQPRVSVSGIAPDAHYKDRAAAYVGLASAHDQEEDAVVLLRD